MGRGVSDRTGGNLGPQEESYGWFVFVFAVAVFVSLAFFAWVYYFDCFVEGVCWLDKLFWWTN